MRDVIQLRFEPLLSPALTRVAEEEAGRERRDASAALLTGQAERATANPFELLSGRQRQVLALIANGLSTKEVAGRLGVSVKTVETHRAAVMAKVGLYSVAELTKYAVLTGLSSLAVPMPTAPCQPAGAAAVRHAA